MADITKTVQPRHCRPALITGNRSHRGGQTLGHLQHRPWRAAADVHRADDRCVSEQRRHVGVGDVADVHEIATLMTVLGDSRRLAALQRAAEDAGDTCVRGVARHPRPVDVVVAQPAGLDVVFSGEGGGEVLLVQLGRCVDVARLQGGVLGDRLGVEHTGTERASGLEPATVEIVEEARAGAHDAIDGTPIPTLAVDHHRRREHDAPGEPALVERREADDPADVVVVDVRSGVAEVHAEPDLAGLVAHRSDAVEGSVPCCDVAHVTPDVLGGGIEVARSCAVRGRGEVVEHHDVCAAFDELVDDARPDESGATGDEDAGHGRHDRLFVTTSRPASPER